MIVVKLMGGLGNQMFQLAFAKAMSIEKNEQIVIDLSGYEKYKIRKFTASNLNIGAHLKNVEDVKIPFLEKNLINFSQSTYRACQKIVRSGKKKKVGKFTYILLAKIGLHYNFDRLYYKTNIISGKNKYIYGYFQSEKYFMKYKKIIKEELKVQTSPTKKEEILLKDLCAKNSVAVSIRLGDDYLNSQALNVCNEEYFYRAMKLIVKQNKDATFYIFSDDIKKVKKLFKFEYPVQYIEEFTDYESLRLMYTCKHFIISNSSFSWWGAYLADNQNKIVISPNKWYNNGSEKPDIFYDELTLIEI